MKLRNLHACLAVFALAALSASSARADDAPAPPPVPAPAAAAAPLVTVELAADDGRATIERRTGTTSPAFGPLDTGFFSVGQWEHACIAPCRTRLDPRFAYRVAGDGLVPTDAFAIPRAGEVRVDAKMGGTNGRVAGAALGMAGTGLLVLGGIALLASPILASEDAGSKGFRTGVLVGGGAAAGAGLLALGAGLAFWLSNGSTAHTQIAAR